MATIIQNQSIVNIQSNTKYIDCSFTNLKDLNLNNVVFEGCYFLSPFVNCKFSLVEFKNDCIINFPSFEECILNQIKIFSIPGIQFLNTELLDCNLSLLNLLDSDFTGSSLYSCDLTNTNLSQSILIDVFSRNIYGTPILPTEWKIISKVLVGPQANLSGLILENENLNGMNLYGVNLTNAVLNNVSIDDTIFFDSVFQGLTSSRIKGIPAVLPIGSWIENERIQYKQDNIYFQNELNNLLNQPKIISSDLSAVKIISGDIFGGKKQNFIMEGICENKIFGLSLPTYNFNNPLIQSNNIHIYDLDTLELMKKLEVPGLHIRCFQVQSLYGGGFSIMGYGVNLGTNLAINPNNNPIQIFKILLDASGNLETFFETSGTKKIPSISKLLGESKPNFIIQDQNYYLSSLDISGNSITNKWKIKCKQDCSGIDFTRKNFSYLDLSGIQFTNCNFTKTNFSYANLTNARMFQCNFNETNFTGANLTNIDLMGSIFIKPIFKNVRITITNSDFTLGSGYKIVNEMIFGPNMNLDGFDLSGYNLSNINFSGSTFRESILTNCNISGTNFNQSIFDKVVSGNLTGSPIFLQPYRLIKGYIVGPRVNLNSADLSGQDLSNLDLTGIQVNSNTNMVGCNFKSTITKNIIGIPNLSLSNKIVNGNILASGVIVSGQDLSNADLSGIDLSNADLRDVLMYRIRTNNILGIPILSSSYKMINGIIFGPGVDLSHKDLSGVLIQSISLKNSNLEQTDLRYSILDNIISGGCAGTPLLSVHWKKINGYLIGPKANLSGENLNGFNLENTFLENTIFSGSTLKNIRSGGINGRPVLPNGYKLLNGYIVGPEVDLSGANLDYQDLSNLDLFETNLTRAKLNYSILTGCFLFQTNLDQIEYKRIVSGKLLGNPKNLPSNLKIFNLLGNQELSRYFVGPNLNLSGIEFKELNLEGIDLSGSILNNVFFNQCNMEKTNLFNCSMNAVRSFSVSGLPIFPDPNWNIRNGFLIGPNANLMFQDLTNLDLSGTNLSNVNLNKVKFSMTRSGPFDGFPFIDENYKVIKQNNNKNYLIGSGMDLEKLDLSGVDLSLMNLSFTNLDKTKLENSNLNKVSSGSIKGIPYSLPPKFRLESGYLLGPSVNLSYSNLERVIMNGIDFTGANFKGSNIKNSFMQDVSLNQVISGDLIGVPFELDNKYRIVNGYFVGSNMNLEDVNLSFANLSGLNLSGTNFKGSNLSNVNFSESNLSGCIFIGANLIGIIPNSILDTIDLTGAILPTNNYSQYNRIISDQLTRTELSQIYYSQVKKRVLDNLFDASTYPKESLLLSSIKQIHYPTYQKLFQLYTILGNGLDLESTFDLLELKEIDLRFQINYKMNNLIQKEEFSDELLCRLMNRMDIETIPDSFMKILNVRLVSVPTLIRFYMKHMFNPKFHDWILMIHPIILSYIEKFFRSWSKIYQNNHWVKNLYGVNNHYVQSDYQRIYQMYPKQMELFEMYMYSEDILNEFTNSEVVYDLFQEVIGYNPNGFTPVVKDLFTRIGTKIYRISSISFIIRLNRVVPFIDFSFELAILKSFINKNRFLVQNIFDQQKNFEQIWIELNKNEPDIYVIQNLGLFGDDLLSIIIQLRTILFYLLKEITYSEVSTDDITKSIIQLGKGNLESLNQLSDTNLQSVLPYLIQNPFVQNIIENPEELINVIESPTFSDRKDLYKLYGLDYLDSVTKDKLIEMDIHQKLHENELYYLRLFSGTNSGTGKDRFIAPFNEYKRIWNQLMNE